MRLSDELRFALLRTDYDPIFDVGDAGRRPRDALGFLAFDPGADGTPQDHLAAISFDGDPIGVHLGVALERVLDLALDVGGLDLGADRNHVAHALDAFRFSHGALGGGLLILPLRRPLQGDPAVLDNDLDLVVRNRQVRLHGGNRIPGNGRTRTLIYRWQPDLDIICDRVNAGDALAGKFGFQPVGVAVGEARQRNDAILHGDGDVFGVKVGIPFQLFTDIALDFTIGFHGWLLVCELRLGVITLPIVIDLMRNRARGHDDGQLPP